MTKETDADRSVIDHSIEHLNGPSLAVFPQMIFGTFRPKVVLITTPNFEVSFRSSLYLLVLVTSSDVLLRRQTVQQQIPSIAYARRVSWPFQGVLGPDGQDREGV